MTMRYSFRQLKCATILLSALIPLSTRGQVTVEEASRIEQAAPARPYAAPHQPRRLLVFNLSLGYKHTAIPYAAKALEILGKKTGAFEVVQSDDMNVFKPEQLQQFDAVCFNNTTQLTFDDPALRKSLLDFIAGGKGIVGIHAATDNFPTWPEAVALFGGSFDGHPWTADGNWKVKVDDPTHTLNLAFGGKGFEIHDEIYRVKQADLRKTSRVVLGLDMKDQHTRSAKGVKPSDRDIPISWIRLYGKGRLFYCSLGHNHEVYSNPAILKHYLDGIQFALGDLSVDATPIPFDPMTFFDQDSLNAILKRMNGFEFGDSRAPMTDLNEFIRQVGDIPVAMVKLESQFLQFLKSHATVSAKQFICTRLSQFATRASVPTLTDMLRDSALTSMALFALERIPDMSADVPLLALLPSAKGKTQIGIINMLGNRRVEEAVGPIAALLSSGNPEIAGPAAAALGNIGSQASLAALLDFREKTRVEVSQSVLEAILVCAGKVGLRGERDVAMKAYRLLSGPEVPVPVRCAALRGMMHTDEDVAAEVIASTLAGPDPALQAATLMLVPELRKPETIHAIAGMFPRLNHEGQAQLLSVLTYHRDPIFRGMAVGALKSSAFEVRVAALRALGKVGDSTSVRLLVQNAAVTQGQEQQEARAALYRIDAPGVDETVVLMIQESTPANAVELVKCAGERRIEAAVLILLKSAGDRSGEVRRQSVRVLKNLCGGEHLPEMISLLGSEKVDAIRGEIEVATAAVALRIPDPEKRDGPILATLQSTKKKENRLSLIRVLGKVGAPSSLTALRSGLSDKDADIRLAAIRALSQWSTEEPYPDLWKLATHAKEKTHRVIALRGAVRLLGLDKNRSVEDAYARYKEAMAAASNRDERRLLLSAVGEARSLAGFKLAADYLADDNLRQEAQLAVANIAQEIAPQAGRQLSPALEQVVRETKDDTVRQRARSALKSIEK